MSNGALQWLEWLSDSSRLLEDFPPLVQDITRAYAGEYGYLSELAGPCQDTVARALEQIVKERLDVLFSKGGDSPEDILVLSDKVEETACLALIWAQYLEPGTRGIKSRGRAKAAQFLNEGYGLNNLLPSSWPKNAADAVRGMFVKSVYTHRGRLKSTGVLSRLSQGANNVFAALLRNVWETRRLGDPFIVPWPPSPYVHREEKYNDLVQGLEKCAGGCEPFLVTGPPGAGKAMLVAEFARQAKDKGIFPHGVYWVELGEAPQLLRKMKGLAARLGRSMPLGPISIKAAMAWLGETLVDKAVLLVLVNAWQAEHVRPFLVGGERCRVVVTASPGVADDLGLPQEQELGLAGMKPDEGMSLVERMLGSHWDEGDRQDIEEIGERVFWSPYALKHLARIVINSLVGWEDLKDQLKRTLVTGPHAVRLQWQKALKAVHKVWLRSLGDAVSLLPSWADVPWFSSFDLQVVQAVYGVDRELAAERLGILLAHGLVQSVKEARLEGPRYRWEPLMWDFVRQQFVSSSSEQAFDWVDRYSGGWGQAPPWRISVPGRSVWALQPWHPRWWLMVDTRAVGLSGVERFIPWMHNYALARLREKRLEWPAEVWATWHRLGRRTVRLIQFSIPWLIGWFLVFWGALRLLPPRWLFRVFSTKTSADWTIAPILVALLAPIPWMWIAHILSGLRALDRWACDNKADQAE